MVMLFLGNKDRNGASAIFLEAVCVSKYYEKKRNPEFYGTFAADILRSFTTLYSVNFHESSILANIFDVYDPIFSSKDLAGFIIFKLHSEKS